MFGLLIFYVINEKKFTPYLFILIYLFIREFRVEKDKEKTLYVAKEL